MNIICTDEKIEINSENAIENAYLSKFKECSIEFIQIDGIGGKKSFLTIKEIEKSDVVDN